MQTPATLFPEVNTQSLVITLAALRDVTNDRTEPCNKQNLHILSPFGFSTLQSENEKQMSTSDWSTRTDRKSCLTTDDFYRRIGKYGRLFPSTMASGLYVTSDSATSSPASCSTTLRASESTGLRRTGS